MLSKPIFRRHRTRVGGTYVIVACLVGSLETIGAELTQDEAVQRALQADPWIQASNLKEQSGLAMSQAAGELPDPRLSLAVANLPVDTFDFGQEPMTQVQVSASQMFPRGDTRALKRRRFEEQAAQQPLMRAERRAQVRKEVSQLWADAWQAQQSLALIAENRVLFQQLGDVATSSYRSAYGMTRQQDIISAELELTRLDDRVAQLQIKYDQSRSELAQWLAAAESGNSISPLAITLAEEPPELTSVPQAEQTFEAFLAHPMIRLNEQKESLARTDADLARQNYEPAWGLSAGYGFRGDDPMGRDRPDFLTVGVTMEVPLFSRSRNDSEVKAAQSEAESVRTERLLQLRQMQGAWTTGVSRYQRTLERLDLYRDRLLPQIEESTTAALNGYTRDTGTFTDVVRGRIAELNARLMVIELTADALRIEAQLDYLQAQAHPANTQTLDAEERS